MMRFNWPAAALPAHLFRLLRVHERHVDDVLGDEPDLQVRWGE
jgi:hypothetical protein